MYLADVIGRWIGKVEIVLSGADEDLREGEMALAANDAMRARSAARRVLVRAPGSPIGLALLADACEAAQLDAELALTLEELAQRAPSRAEVWVRLARARQVTQATTDDVRDALARALAVAESGSEARRDALLALADLDLAQGDGARAELWLERAALPEDLPAGAIRRAEARLLRGDAAGALARLNAIQLSPADGRAALVRGRALFALGDPEAFAPLVRAMVLDVPGATEALSSAIASVPNDAQTRSRVRSVVDAKGEQDLARWRAAFARAEGAREAARRALREALDAGDRTAARPLLDAAIEDQDATSLASALAQLASESDDPLLTELHALSSAATLTPSEKGETILDEVASLDHPRVASWAQAIVARVARDWVPESGAPADWFRLLRRLDAHARALADLDSIAAIADLAVQRGRPLRVAIVGEFNAGKSTFINALMGADIAPTGVLPTTASLHHMRWAPDPIARIFFEQGHEPPERILPIGELRAAHESLDAAEIRRVELLLPLPLLLRVEILDTPGFNAPNANHTRVALSAFEEADVAIWLLDATQALKESERAVIEQVRRARIPLQVLVNKADRLSATDLVRVMKSVDDALVEGTIHSRAAPLALSAKLALASKLGDEKARGASGWDAVQTMLEEQIVARHSELKERALRRRATQIVSRLSELAGLAADRQRCDGQARASRAQAIAQTAAAIEREANRVGNELARSLRLAAQALGHDLALVFIGRDPEMAAQDPILDRYRTDRAVATLAPPLARALAALAPEAELTASRLAPTARTLVRATAYASPSHDPQRLVESIARAAVATLVDQLFGLSVVLPAKEPAAGLVRELAGFGAELSRPLPAN